MCQTSLPSLFLHYSRDPVCVRCGVGGGNFRGPVVCDPYPIPTVHESSEQHVAMVPLDPSRMKKKNNP